MIEQVFDTMIVACKKTVNVNLIYSGYALFRHATKQRKQIFQINVTWLKNPNWQEADQLAIYKA